MMKTADNMRRLTENIIVSREARGRTLDDLLSGTQKTVRLLSKTRKKSSRDQAMELNGFAADLSKNVCEILKNAKDRIKEFEQDNKKIGEEQSKNLALFVKTLNKSTITLLNDFKLIRVRTNDELKDNLNIFIAGLIKEVKAIKKSINLLLNEYATENKEARNAWLGMTAASARTRKNMAVAEPVLFTKKKAQKKRTKR